MALSMYDISVPAFTRGLINLSGLLDKGAAHAQEQGYDPTQLVQARLFDDMLPLAGQIQRASDTSKGAVARLAGVAVPSFDDTESTLAELKARIAKTVDFIKTIEPAQMDGSETRAIELPTRQGVQTFDGKSYLLGFSLPNFYFHVTTAYDILRHRGVSIGKQDYLGGR
ncbi:DUF1993 domain-containing protein [Burkholderia alba]|uniref:DUF1993 domain-containing protein n=1 Tax=Burkholderia alba TaxID=2683677 RepID=UPI002B05DEF6|nr:DUF1993 domain-containing protein [Burkholderia alba]